MSKGNFACPTCGSHLTYVRRRDGKVYYRSKTGTYACRRCGFGQDNGVKPEFLGEMADRVRAECRETGTVAHCPVCGDAVPPTSGGDIACSRCGFFTHARGIAGYLKGGFLASLPPLREIRRGRPAADTQAPLPPPGLSSAPLSPAASLPFRKPLPATPASPALAINGHPLALKREAGVIWIVVEAPAVGFPFAGPEPYPIPAYETEFLATLDLTHPVTVAEAWKAVLTRAMIGQNDFLKEFPAKLDGLTPALVADLQAKRLLSRRALNQVRLAFLNERRPGTTTSLGYAAMAFELGLLDRLDEEIDAARAALIRLRQAEDDDDGIPPSGEEKQYYPVPVPAILPPVDEILISFDGGKTRWVFVASHPTPGGDE